METTEATMPRKPGTPKTGGRTAGTPNRRNAALAVDIVERSLWSVALAARR